MPVLVVPCSFDETVPCAKQAATPSVAVRPRHRVDESTYTIIRYPDDDRGRRWLYTVLTRAKDRLELVGVEEPTILLRTALASGALDVEEQALPEVTFEEEDDERFSPMRYAAPRTMADGRSFVLAALVLGAGCRPVAMSSDPVGVPEEMPAENTAQALRAAAASITRVDIVELGTSAVRGSLDVEALARLKTALAASAVHTSLTVTTPPWDVVLHLHVPGRPPFVAHFVGFGRLRVRAVDPEDQHVGVEDGSELALAELDTGAELFDVLQELLGKPGKEYQGPTIDLGLPPGRTMAHEEA